MKTYKIIILYYIYNFSFCPETVESLQQPTQIPLNILPHMSPKPPQTPPENAPQKNCPKPRQHLPEKFGVDTEKAWEIYKNN